MDYSVSAYFHFLSLVLCLYHAFYLCVLYRYMLSCFFFIFRFLKTNNQVVADGGSLWDSDFAGEVEFAGESSHFFGGIWELVWFRLPVDTYSSAISRIAQLNCVIWVVAARKCCPFCR
jgi:hypothetical protein